MAIKRTGVKARASSLQIWFNYEGERVFETLEWNPTETNLDRAARLRKQVVEEIKAGVFSYAAHFPNSPRAAEEKSSEAPTFFDVAKQFLAMVDTDHCRADYRNALNRTWGPLFDLPVDEVHYSHLLQCAERLDGKSAKYYNNEKVSLNGVLSLAKDMDYIENNPASKLKNRKVTKDDADPFSQEEAESVIAHMYEYYGEVYGCYTEIGFFTGLRAPSEMIGLRWENVDLRSGYLRVIERTVKGEHKAGTKTGKARDVELFDRVQAALRRLRKYSDEWVFICPDTNEPFKTGKALVARWNTALSALQIRRRRMYNMRHTCATYLLEHDVSPGAAAEQLGHSLQMFFTVYAKWLNADKKKAELQKANQAPLKNVAATAKKARLI